MNDFLNPKSMLTPGMAGALVMFLSNAICYQFPELAPRWIALSLSFLIGFLVVVAASLKWLHMTGFWLVNSLIIFAVAAGSAGVAFKTAPVSTSLSASIVHFVVPQANAQAIAKEATPSIHEQLSLARAQIEVQKKQLEEARRKSANVNTAPIQQEIAKVESQAAKNRRFFKEW